MDVEPSATGVAGPSGDDFAVPAAVTIHEAIDWWSERRPEAPALLDISGTTISYRELHQRVLTFGERLGALGIRREDRVLLALPDGVGAALAGVATSRVAVGAPVNPSLTRLEAGPTLAALDPRVVIVADGSDTVWRDLAAQAGVPVMEFDPWAAEWGPGAMAGTSPPGPDPADVALILSTSGTTDQPRRVAVTHRCLWETCAARAIPRRYSPGDRGLNASPASFVLGLARVMDSLITGGSAIVASAAQIVLQPEAVRDARPTWTWLAPALLETILAAARGNAAFAQWPLRLVRTGGAQVTPELIARVEALWRVPVLIGYGTTETLGFIASEESPEIVARKPGSVGRVRPGVDVAIRDGDGTPLAPGSGGEITVRGSCVFAGYLDDPVATAAAFHRGGWHRTGDLGHVDGDGYLFVDGRINEMINRGGEKIAPHEIDVALRSHPAVADAAAFAVPHPRLGEEAAAAVVLRERCAATPWELRCWVADRLSRHKVPRRMWFVDAIPRTGTGKVQRGELARMHGVPEASSSDGGKVR